MTREMSAQEAREAWKDILDAAEHRGEVTTITRYGKAAADLVPHGFVDIARIERAHSDDEEEDGDG